MKLSIIIVNYNTEEVLKSCLMSLHENYSNEFDKKFFEIVVVDNASTDNSVQLMKKTFPAVKIIQNISNIGFAKANNQGAKKTKSDYVLLLNPDTLVYKNTLHRILDYLERHEDAGIATCKVMLSNGEIDDASHRGFPTPWRAFTHFSGLSKLLPFSTFFNGYHLGNRNMDRIHEIDACAGAFLMLRRSVGDLVGWLDEEYFWYGDDLDLCYRVKQAGYKIMYIPDVAILHYKGVSSGIKNHSKHMSKADASTRKRVTSARFEVMRIFYRKHYIQKYPRWQTMLVFWGISLLEKMYQLSL